MLYNNDQTVPCSRYAAQTVHVPEYGQVVDLATTHTSWRTKWISDSTNTDPISAIHAVEDGMLRSGTLSTVARAREGDETVPCRLVIAGNDEVLNPVRIAQ